MPTKDKELTGTFGDAEEARTEIINGYLSLVESPQLSDPKAMAMQIVQRILSADSLEALEGIVVSGTVDAADLVGKPFIIETISFHRASEQYRENSAGVFVALTIKKEDGTNVVVTNGGENVVAISYKLVTLGGLPTNKPWTFRSAVTAQGFTTYWLMPA